MQKTFLTTLTTVLTSCALAFSAAAGAADHQHPGGAETAAMDAMPGMMMERMQMMHGGDVPAMPAAAPCGKPCRQPPSDPAMHHMTGAGMRSMEHEMAPGMMRQRMDRPFFLDRVEALELSADQVARLKEIRAACRRDNIRFAAEARIARLELVDLLNEAAWQVKDAERLIRQVQQVEGDMQVRHLQAVADARRVLTAEQLQKAQAGGHDDELEALFQ